MKVYLPPPLKFVDVRRPTPKKKSGYCNGNELSMEETENRRHVSPLSPTNSYTDAYPSPSSSKPSLSSHAKRARNYTPPRSRPGVRVVTSYRPPSPPTSDLPIPSDADIHVDVDHEGIQLRYAEMKRLSRKVLCSFFIFHPFPFLLLSATQYLFFFWYSADAQVLMYGIWWESIVVVMFGKMLRAVDSLKMDSNRKFR